jgi:predicted metal-dependent phosphoesterase TrpH
VLADFHLHSYHSDGRLDPAALVDVVADAGIRLFALTDHDTTAGHAHARARAAERGICFVPGIEMTTYAHGRVVHVLGLGCAGDDAGLRSANAVAQDVWDANQRRWVEALAGENGLDWQRDFPDHPVRLPQLIERLCLAGVDGGDPKKVHARFKTFFAALAPEAYAKLPDPSAAATVIRRAGGIALLAHPWTLAEAGLVRDLLAACDGLEAVYLPYASERRAALMTLATSQGKMHSGGSDFHGYFDPEYRSPGFEPAAALLERLGVPAD